MPDNKNNEIKPNLHPRNKNIERYDLKSLTNVLPELEEFVKPNKYGNLSIDFSNPIAVKLLNQAILKHYYGIEFWDFPAENLCPPIPGRADYLHYIADLLAKNNQGEIPTGNHIKILDIGVGASLIYPIIGVSEYQWSFIGSDVNEVSIESSQQIIDKNPILKNKVELRLQKNQKEILNNIISKDEKIDFVMCNPPYHATLAKAKKGTQRKVKNLTGKNMINPPLNFSGINEELVYDGGEFQFIKKMIEESKLFSENCLWFSTLISKQSNVAKVRNILEKSGTADIRTIKMGTSNKATRFMAWSFLNNPKREDWIKNKLQTSF